MKTAIREALRDRAYVTALVVTAIALVAVLVLCVANIHPSELQVPIRNTVFGTRYTYQEQWYNELAFAGFAILVATFHTVISARLYAMKDRRYSIAFQWLTVAMLLISFLVFVAIFRVISVVQ